MKKKNALSLLGIAFLCLTLVGFTFGTAFGENLRLGANVVGGLMYVVSGGLAGVLEKNSSVKLELLPQGNVVAFPMFSTKECDLLVAATDEADLAYQGKAIYGKMTNGKGIDQRMLMIGNPIQAGLLVAADSGIKTAEDLKGKRITLDFGSHHALSMGARTCLIGLGLKDTDVKTVKSTNLPAAMRLVLEGKADACFGAIGTPAFMELQAARGARYIGLNSDPETWKKIKSVFIGYFPAKVEPSKVAIGVDKPMVLLGKNFSLIARTDLSDETAYTITKTLWEHDTELAPYHPKLKGWIKKFYVSTNSPVPYHPGAIKFYQEVGAWNEKMQKHQEAMLALKK